MSRKAPLRKAGVSLLGRFPKTSIMRAASCLASDLKPALYRGCRSKSDPSESHVHPQTPKQIDHAHTNLRKSWSTRHVTNRDALGVDELDAVSIASESRVSDQAPANNKARGD